MQCKVHIVWALNPPVGYTALGNVLCKCISVLKQSSCTSLFSEPLEISIEPQRDDSLTAIPELILQITRPFSFRSLFWFFIEHLTQYVSALVFGPWLFTYKVNPCIRSHRDTRP